MGLAFASAAFLRASASASARFAAGVNCFCSGDDAAVADLEGLSVIANFQPRKWAAQIQGFVLKMILPW
jgi:hypothetical protein